jgi:outer membrane protein TolC
MMASNYNHALGICLLVSFVYFLNPNHGNSQSIEELLRAARTENPALLALEKEYASAQFWADQNDDYPDPVVSLGLGILPIETRLGAQRLRLGITQMIPWKGLLEAKASLATAQAATLKNQADSKFINIEYKIRKAYAELILNRGQVDIIHEKIAVLDVLEELAKSAVRSGEGKLSNVLMVQRNRENLLFDLQILEHEKWGPTIEINRWTSRPLEKEIVIEVDTFNEPDGMKAERDHPYIRILEAQQKASEVAIELVHYSQKPAIGIGLDYAFIDGRSEVDLSGNGRDVLMPMASISIPLNGSKYTEKKQEERLKQEAIDLKIRNALREFEAEKETAKSKIILADTKIAKYKELKNITQETIELMRTEYASEGTRFEELIRLELELVEYNKALLMAGHVKNLAYALLEKYR